MKPEGRPVVELFQLEFSPDESALVKEACEVNDLPFTAAGVRDLLLGLLDGSVEETEGEEDDEPGPDNDASRGHRIGEALGNFLADEHNRAMLGQAARTIMGAMRRK